MQNGADVFGYSQQQVAPLVNIEYAAVVEAVVNTRKPLASALASALGLC